VRTDWLLQRQARWQDGPSCTCSPGLLARNCTARRPFLCCSLSSSRLRPHSRCTAAPRKNCPFQEIWLLRGRFL
jgi:hypothetical protein